MTKYVSLAMLVQCATAQVLFKYAASNDVEYAGYTQESCQLLGSAALAYFIRGKQSDEAWSLEGLVCGDALYVKPKDETLNDVSSEDELARLSSIFKNNWFSVSADSCDDLRTNSDVQNIFMQVTERECDVKKQYPLVESGYETYLRQKDGKQILTIVKRGTPGRQYTSYLTGITGSSSRELIEFPVKLFCDFYDQLPGNTYHEVAASIPDSEDSIAVMCNPGDLSNKERKLKNLLDFPTYKKFYDRYHAGQKVLGEKLTSSHNLILTDAVSYPGMIFMICNELGAPIQNQPFTIETIQTGTSPRESSRVDPEDSNSSKIETTGTQLLYNVVGSIAAIIIFVAVVVSVIRKRESDNPM